MIINLFLIAGMYDVRCLLSLNLYLTTELRTGNIMRALMDSQTETRT